MSDRPRLTVCGGARLDFPATGTALGARKPVALLALLMFGDSASATRDYLAGMLWGDSDDARSRGSLRQLLKELRDADPGVADFLRTDRLAIRLERDALDTDLGAFLARLESGGDAANGPASPPLPQHFLHGFESIGEGFADWLAQVRAQLHRDLLARLEAGAQARMDDPAACLGFARAALVLEPLSETAARAAMEVLARMGDTGQALGLYARLYDQLAEALGMEPSPQTQDLAVRIKQGEFDAPPAPRTRPAALGQPILGVLPMVALGPDPVPPDIREMLVEDMISQFARLPDVPVLSNVTTRALQGDLDPLQSLARKHRARYALRTSIRRHGGQYRLAAQLCEAESGLVVWAQSLDGAEPDIFGLQAGIVARLVHVLAPSIQLHETQRSGDLRLSDLSAYHRLLRARELIYSLQPDAFRAAHSLLQETVAQYPDFLPAHLLLADWYSLSLGQGWSRDRGGDTRAIGDCLTRALRLSPDNARAQAMAGHNIAIYEHRHDEALRLFGRALAEMPNDPETLVWTGPTLAFVGEAGAAIGHLERAIALSPVDPLMFRLEHFLAVACYAADDAERTAALALRAHRRNPNYLSNIRLAAAALVQLGRMDEARDMAAQVLRLEPDFRVQPHMTRQAFRDERRRAALGQQMIAAGLPP